MIFSKYTALGNDYIVIDPNKNKDLNIDLINIKDICNRRYGIGADGILYGPLNSHLSLRIFNSDGSECEKSGNGLRIFSHYLYHNNYLKENNFSISLKEETISIEIINANEGIFKINMGKANLKLKEHNVQYKDSSLINSILEVEGHKLKSTFVSMGNPHLVIEVDELSQKLVKEIGPIISNLVMFPERTNVQFCKILNKNNIQIEIYERGSGYTLASGSSSCAAAFAIVLSK